MTRRATRRPPRFRRPSRPHPPTPSVAPSEPSKPPDRPLMPWVGLAGFLLIGWVYLSGTQFAQMLPGLPGLPAHGQIPVLGLGLLLIATAVRADRGSSSAPEPSQAWARSLFILLMITGIAVRLYQPGQPPYFYWDDHSIILTDVRAILDLGDRPLLFPYGWREPLYPYLLAGIWSWMPQQDGIFVFRIASALIDFFTLWCLYLIGRELSGRLLGLIALGLGIFAKPLLVLGIGGYGNTTATLGTALALLFTLRVLRKPSNPHFLQWGAALAFGAVTYIPCRPWAPTLMSLVGLWLWTGSRERPGLRGRLLLLWGWAGAALFYLDRNRYLPSWESWQPLLKSWFFWGLWWGGLAFLGAGTLRGSAEGDRRVRRWMTGILFAGLLMAPILLHPGYALHTTDASVFHRGQGIAAVIQNFQRALDAFLWGGTNDNIYFMREKMYFDLLITWGLVAGAAVALARFDGRWWMILLLLVVGTVPYALGANSYSSRLVATIVPAILLASRALERLAFPFPRGGFRVARWVIPLVFLAVGVFNVRFQVSNLLDWFHRDAFNVMVQRQVVHDHAGFHLVLAEHDASFFTGCVAMSSDQKGVRMLGRTVEQMTIVEDPDRPKDVVVLVSGLDQRIQDRLKRDYPAAHWEAISGSLTWPKPFMWRVQVAHGDWSENRGIFRREVRDPGTWWRRVYAGPAGLSRGVITYEDQVKDLKTPWPTLPPRPLRIEGPWTAPADGIYVFKIGTEDPTRLSVDDRILFHVTPRQRFTEVRHSIRLKAGVRRILWESYPRSGRSIPEVRIETSDGRSLEGWVRP